MGTQMKLRSLPSAHPLLCSLVPNRPCPGQHWSTAWGLGPLLCGTGSNLFRCWSSGDTQALKHGLPLMRGWLCWGRRSPLLLPLSLYYSCYPSVTPTPCYSVTLSYTPTLQPPPSPSLPRSRSQSFSPSPQLSLPGLWEAQPPSMVWRQGGAGEESEATMPLHRGLSLSRWLVSSSDRKGMPN